VPLAATADDVRRFLDAIAVHVNYRLSSGGAGDAERDRISLSGSIWVSFSTPDPVPTSSEHLLVTPAASDHTSGLQKRQEVTLYVDLTAESKMQKKAAVRVDPIVPVLESVVSALWPAGNHSVTSFPFKSATSNGSDGDEYNDDNEYDKQQNAPAIAVEVQVQRLLDGGEEECWARAVCPQLPAGQSLSDTLARLWDVLPSHWLTLDPAVLSRQYAALAPAFSLPHFDILLDRDMNRRRRLLLPSKALQKKSKSDSTEPEPEKVTLAQGWAAVDSSSGTSGANLPKLAKPASKREALRKEVCRTLYGSGEVGRQLQQLLTTDSDENVNVDGNIAVSSSSSYFSAYSSFSSSSSSSSAARSTDALRDRMAAICRLSPLIQPSCNHVQQWFDQNLSSLRSRSSTHSVTKGAVLQQ
jgi:hypothetical protein